MALRSFVLHLTSFCLLSLPITSVNAQLQIYPPEIVKNYIDSCTAGRGLEVEAVCACTIKRIQTIYTLEEFKKINSQIQVTGKIPPSLIVILNACQDDPNS